MPHRSSKSFAYQLEERKRLRKTIQHYGSTSGCKDSQWTLLLLDAKGRKSNRANFA
jgi:hypothetical protein